MHWGRQMEMTANTKRALTTFFGLLFCLSAIPALAAAQSRGPSDLTDRKLTPCDFLDDTAAQFEHGSQPSVLENQFLARLRKHAAEKSYAAQKECAYDFMRLRRKVVQATMPQTDAFNHIADLKQYPRAYVGRPMVVYGRVTAMQTSATGGSTLAQLLELDSDTVVANVDVLDAATAPRQFPAEGLPVRVVGFLIKTLEGNVPYFCAQRLEWLSVEVDPVALDVVRHKTRGIRPEEASAYYETLMRSRILPLEDQQQYASAWLKARIEQRLEQAQAVHTEERREAEKVRMTDDQRATKMIRTADARLLGEQKRHNNYVADPTTFPVFADVFLNPDVYKGKPVTMRGHVRKVMSYPADVDRYGAGTLHELWLFTDDSQQNPAVVVCSELPKDFPTGAGVVEGVSVTGYFFKLYRYAADDANRAAPMLLAHQVRWQPRTASYAGFGSFGTLATVIAMFAGAALMMYLWSNHEGDRRAKEALAMARVVDDNAELPVRFPSPDLLPPRTATRGSHPMSQPLPSRSEAPVDRTILPPPQSQPSVIRPSALSTDAPEPAPAAPSPRSSSLEPLFKPKETVERVTDRTVDFVGEQTDRAGDVVPRQRERAGDTGQKNGLAQAASNHPLAPAPRAAQSQEPEARHKEPTRRSRSVSQSDRAVQPSQVVGSQILRVLQQDANSQASRIELSNGSTLTLTNDVVGIDNLVQRGARSDRDFSQLEGLQIDHIAVDQWERAYIVAARDVFITEDFAENGERCLIYGSLSSLITEEPDLTLSDYWTRTPIAG